MKKSILIIALILVASAGLILAGCGPKSGTYGKGITETKSTPVSELFKNADNLAGKEVRVEGKIVQECPAGGWFVLKDDTGTILVDLHPTQIAIPQAVGHSVAAQGKVKKEYGQISVVGEGVDLK